MLLRALVAFLALPGVIAFLVPALYLSLSPPRRSASGFGIALWTSGGMILVWCVRAFYVDGKGTLAPWSPPRHLVRQGLYRFTRNPMYVGVLLVLAGWALAYGSLALAGYASLVAVGFHLRVVLAEEPWLAGAFGSEWQAYRQAVPRWFWPQGDCSRSSSLETPRGNG